VNDAVVITLTAVASVTFAALGSYLVARQQSCRAERTTILLEELPVASAAIERKESVAGMSEPVRALRSRSIAASRHDASQTQDLLTLLDHLERNSGREAERGALKVAIESYRTWIENRLLRTPWRRT
jgi:type II secretory pathway component PulJ